MRRHPTSGEAATPQLLPLPLPRLRGSSAEGSEGVFPLKTPLPLATYWYVRPPKQKGPDQMTGALISSNRRKT